METKIKYFEKTLEMKVRSLPEQFKSNYTPQF